MKRPKEPILFLPMNLEVPPSPEETLLEVALRYKLDLGNSCGGMGTCTTCRIVVEKGVEKLGEREAAEAEMASERQFSKE